jgi:hypothetical protein
MIDWQPRYGISGEYRVVDLDGKPVIIACETRDDAIDRFIAMTHDPENFPNLSIEHFHMWVMDGGQVEPYNPRFYTLYKHCTKEKEDSTLPHGRLTHQGRELLQKR